MFPSTLSGDVQLTRSLVDLHISGGRSSPSQYQQHQVEDLHLLCNLQRLLPAFDLLPL